MRDWRGSEIVIGSRVVYPFNTSTSVIQVMEGVVESDPYLEGRWRVHRLDVRISGWSGPNDWPGHWGLVQALKANRLTVVCDAS